MTFYDVPTSLVAQDDFGDIESFVIVRLKDHAYAIANAVFEFDAATKTATVFAEHTWAKRDFDTFAKISRFDFTNVKPTELIGNFSAKISVAYLYPKNVENQFTDAMEESEDDLMSPADAAYLNTGYVELPPANAELSGNRAIIELFNGSPDKISEKVRDLLLRH